MLKFWINLLIYCLYIKENFYYFVKALYAFLNNIDLNLKSDSEFTFQDEIVDLKLIYEIEK